MMIIETHCFIYNKKQNEELERLKDLGIDLDNKEEEVLCPFCFKLEEISSCRPEVDDSGVRSTINSVIYMKGGESFVINMSYETLLKTIKDNK